MLLPTLGRLHVSSLGPARHIRAMARHIGGIAGLAAGVVVASLVVAQVIALFIVLLLAAFVLLAVAVVDSERGVEQLSASPRWSLRSAIRRLARRMRAAITRFGRRVAAITRGLLAGAVRGTRTGFVQLGRRSAHQAQRSCRAMLTVTFPNQSVRVPSSERGLS